MNLVSKVLLLSCMTTGGLHCWSSEEAKAIQVEISALLEVLKRCDQRDIHSLQKNSTAAKNGNDAFMAYFNEVTACELAQENLRKIMVKIQRNYSHIKF